jgi:signal transduction histidine kinase
MVPEMTSTIRRVPIVPRPAVIFMATLSTAWIVALAFMVAANLREIRVNLLTLGIWFLVIAIVNLVPATYSRHAHLSPDLPLLIGGALVLTPTQIGLVAFLAAFDIEELRGQRPLTKALYNRSQTGLAACLASGLVHSIRPAPASSPTVLPLAFIALGMLIIVNYACVASAVHLMYQERVTHALSDLALGKAIDLAITFLAWGVLGAMLAALYDQIASWSVPAFLAPTLLGRQVLLRSQMYLDRDRAYRSREAALEQIARTIREERSDERRMIASDLHDEVLQPLFKASLMAHVLKADLATGRLLQMDEDIPELVAAAEIAATSLRELIGDLRKSPLGTGGVSSAIRNLVRNAKEQATAEIQAEVADVKTTADYELTLYQIAKEALSNAVTHADARHILVQLTATEDSFVLTVSDDGHGFDPWIEYPGHYGIEIMRERTAVMGGELWIDASPRGGTRVSAIFPQMIPPRHAEEHASS